MSRIGTVSSVWRYPVKSMRGEERETIFVGGGGIDGDRLFAFGNSASPKDFPYLTARQLPALLRYRPRFPDNGNSATATRKVEVQTPDGETLAIDDPALIRRLGEGLTGDPTLTLLQSERAMTDCRPVSLFSLQTARQIGDEVGRALNPLRFRANLYLDLAGGAGFAEDEWVGHTLRIGADVVLSVLERDRRCRMISLDPDTGDADAAVLRNVAREHGGTAGVYAAVLAEGVVRRGDAVTLLDR